MKPEVWEQILRPALADQKGSALFIGTPMGRNHFYDLHQYASISEDDDWAGYHFTSYDNPLLDKEEIDARLRSRCLPSPSVRSLWHPLRHRVVNSLRKNTLQFSEEEPDGGQFYIAVDLAGFADIEKATTKTNRLDQTSIAVVKAGTEGWWVADIIHGRWGVEKTARKIFEAVRDYRPVAVGIEKGALKNAVYPYLNDIMKAESKVL